MSGVRRVRSLALPVLAVLAASAFASPAAAAPLPALIGQTATEFNSGHATSAGGCECTLAQFGETVGPFSPSYVVPYDGVIVASGVYVGDSIEPTDTVRVQTVHRTGSVNGTVSSEGASHSIVGSTHKAVATFYERIPAHAGDVLAARFHVNPFIEETPFFFKTSAPGDETLKAAEAAAGGQLLAGIAVAERRLNLEAEIEPDEDGDGYGDVSQDLCPGSPLATSACSGTLFGSDLQGGRTSLSCGSCMRVQTTINGASTAAPFNGVVVRWRVLNGTNGSYRARVVSLNGIEGAFTKYRVLRSAEPQTVTSPTGSLGAKISSFPTRLPIQAGQFVALSGGGSTGFQASAGTSTNVQTNEPANDGNIATGETHNGTVLYDADIEPDVDGDGYGDVTQDSCPTSAAVHEGPCPSPPSDGGSGGGGSGGSGPVVPIGNLPGKPAPSISSLTLKPKSFLAKPLGAVAARGRTGTTIHLTLSGKATVTLAIEAKQGRRFKTVTKVVKSLNPGKRTIAFNGQYRHAGKLVDLSPGTYRLSVIAKSAGVTGPVARTSFIVLPPT
jgi:hypothetical protein